MDTKKMRPGVKEITRFETTDGRTYTTIEEGNKRQSELDQSKLFIEIEGEMEEHIYKLFNIPYQKKGENEDEIDEREVLEEARLTEIKGVFTGTIDDTQDLLYLMLNFSENFQTEVKLFFAEYNKLLLGKVKKKTKN